MTTGNPEDINSNTTSYTSSNDTLPPLPAAGEYGPHVCEIVSLYLAVLPDLSLSPEQTQILAEHIRICAACAQEQQLMNQATHIVSNLRTIETIPSARIDQVVLAAIAARGSNGAKMGSGAVGEERVRGEEGEEGAELVSILQKHARPNRIPANRPARFARPARVKRRRQQRVFRLLSQLAVAAVILLALLTTLHFATGVIAPASVFALPANLTWNGYVVYHTETQIDGQGERYQVKLYDNLSTGQMHVETIMPGQMDVVVVSEGQQMLGKDMMHNVAQMDPQGWDFDDSTFNLAKLKSDLQAKRATYLDTDTFHGQRVYRVRLANGLVLLLNMDYQPVNVLRGAVGPGTGEPIYDTLKMLPEQKVPDSTWSMEVPSGFHMGTLPPKP